MAAIELTLLLQDWRQSVADQPILGFLEGIAKDLHQPRIQNIPGGL